MRLAIERSARQADAEGGRRRPGPSECSDALRIARPPEFGEDLFDGHRVTITAKSPLSRPLREAQSWVP
jgi:hypothetical protein